MSEHDVLNTTRLEAFSDGVLAVIITIMVLELHMPEGRGWADLMTLVPSFLVYILSFATTGVFWNNHHHVLRSAKRVTAGIMWANLHLLFWISLVPFATAWVGHYHDSLWPAALYGIILIFSGLSFQILQRAIIADVGRNSDLAKALGSDLKGKISLFFYVVGVAIAFWHPTLSYFFYAAVILAWALPDPRIEKQITSNNI